MAASRASSNRTMESGGSRSSAGSKKPRSAGAGKRSTQNPTNASAKTNRTAGGLSNLAEQLVNRIIKPLGLVVLSRERIQETLDEAADRGRLTRTDANELASQLVQRGRQQTEELLADIERLLGRGRRQLDSATRNPRLGEPLDRLVRGAAVARRKVRGETSFPILDYDEMSSAEVQPRLGGLAPPELRRVRDYERRHANRKSVLGAIERALA